MKLFEKYLNAGKKCSVIANLLSLIKKFTVSEKMILLFRPILIEMIFKFKNVL